MKKRALFLIIMLMFCLNACAESGRMNGQGAAISRNMEAVYKDRIKDICKEHGYTFEQMNNPKFPEGNIKERGKIKLNSGYIDLYLFEDVNSAELWHRTEKELCWNECSKRNSEEPEKIYEIEANLTDKETDENLFTINRISKTDGIVKQKQIFRHGNAGYVADFDIHDEKDTELIHDLIQEGKAGKGIG